MNRSSLLSNEDNLSSFLNESGQSKKKCCEYRQKYQEIYREMSQTRIESRNLKQENAVLRNTLKGIQEENGVLKSILANKKEIINKLNYEIRSSNLEVNRLEDQLNNRNEKDAAIQEEIKRTVAITKELEENWRKSKDDYKALMNKYERVNEERQRMKEEHGRQVIRLKEQKRSEIERNNQVFNEKIEQLTYSMQSPSKMSKQGAMRGYTLKENKISSPSTTLKHLDMNINNFKQRWESQEANYEQIVRSKDRQTEELSRKINELEAQAAESMELFEDQIKQMEILKAKLKVSENEKVEQAQTSKSKHTQREQMLMNVNKRLAAILKNSIFCDNIAVVDKLLSILHQNPKKFQTQIIMKQIEASFQANYNNSLKNAVTSQQYDKLTRSLAELQESNDLLQLKYNTLSREYSEVLDDNHRLIKYNNLTRFRVDRNLSGKYEEKVRMDRTPYLTRKGLREEESSNKENLRSTINQ